MSPYPSRVIRSKNAESVTAYTEATHSKYKIGSRFQQYARHPKENMHNRPKSYAMIFQDKAATPKTLSCYCNVDSLDFIRRHMMDQEKDLVVLLAVSVINLHPKTPMLKGASGL